MLTPLYPLHYEPLLRAALAEDLGTAGDLTSDAIVPPRATARAAVVARAPGRVAGVGVATAAFPLLDREVDVRIAVDDGADVAAGTVLALVAGPARAVLSAERVALNLLGRMCGVATATAALVAAIAGHHARIVPTRKTTPGLRALERYAVRAGGGADHRFGLHDGILIKDNHILVAGGITTAVERARDHAGHMVVIEVEVDTLDQLDEALGLGVDAVLLDNMRPAILAQAVARVDGAAVTEASGGIDLTTVRDIAATGVDLISTGWITHSAPALDVALDFAA
ncbi:MAG TPA: carboxylating nicotinate-nucleotide diphosphorylase [Euzebyales bacterium]|nr:carboxylating nicotinate-nucleotide diphosphorylase [Euzebyales bacterium]